MNIRLTRISRAEKAVRGTITGTPHVLPTLENAQYIIPEGKYELAMTWSPRFKKKMPLVCSVPGRAGIRIHSGTRPEHSKGCILMTPKGVETMKDLLTKNAAKNEKIYLIVSRDY
ncbi:MAG: hypothetical protein II551_02800 [Paludibacteraceae bacterium]|nr:hypothetical protein [Paludibacteraceae bacterium]